MLAEESCYKEFQYYGSWARQVALWHGCPLKRNKYTLRLEQMTLLRMACCHDADLHRLKLKLAGLTIVHGLQSV